ncbi:hypothetical protein PCANC_05224 [Puccinia coronata f. sp. avenae]|uniref:Uncharacterized protein n=1 Tax=Puccinia coronata f. sp. avenae TaxID=200324 RepID=A0A2N5TJ79_9BASI|nr:hypothetical protein PCASD_23359 [Puccinia coronata f. sp. avenae]PLW34222.1 hypothetical protein PCASD_15045 [Puccinia coronata f. sp. avenae]PLW54277.1 hypothetical protein PCANC_05224 [Puccinia coronata f. sp. avenae]
MTSKRINAASAAVLGAEGLSIATPVADSQADKGLNRQQPSEENTQAPITGPVLMGDTASRAKKAKTSKSTKGKNTAATHSVSAGGAECNRIWDVDSSDDKDTIFEIAKENIVLDVLNPTLNTQGSLSKDEQSVLWKMARDANIRGSSEAAKTLMSFLNENPPASATSLPFIIPSSQPVGPTHHVAQSGISLVPSALAGRDLVDLTFTAVDSTHTAPLAIPLASQVALGEIGETYMEKGLAFASGAISNSTIIGFSPFLDKCISKLCGTIPLTIFDRKWQEDVQCIHIQKRNRLYDSTKYCLTYIGHPFDREWTQSYKVWEANHQSMHNTLLTVYALKRFASDLYTHKKNCKELCSHHGFLPAFRYDILMRTNTFNHQVLHNSIEHVSDISKSRHIIWQILLESCPRAGSSQLTQVSQT